MLCIAENKYIASVFTMDAKGSGTDADVYLTIFGEFGDTGLITSDNLCVFYDVTQVFMFSTSRYLPAIFRRT